MSRNAAQESTTIMTHANANVVIHQIASIPGITIQTLVNVTADLMTVTQANILTPRAVAANAQSTKHVQTINISTVQLASVNVATSKSVQMANTMIMTHVNASVKIHQLVNIHTITTLILVNVTVDHMIAMLDNTLTPRAVAANAQSTRPATTINTSMVQLASVNAVM